MTASLEEQIERDHEEMQKALDETIADTIRQAWLPNTVGWLAVVIGAFVINLLILVAISGG